MKAPWTRYGMYTIKYKQVPYDNRYFFVYYDGYEKEIMRVPHCLMHIIEGFAAHTFWNHKQSYDRFIARVDEYNKWLDEEDKK